MTHRTTTTSSRPPRTTSGCTSPGTRRTTTPTCRSSCAGEGPYIWDAKGKRYLDAPRRSVREPARPRPDRARRRRREAGARAGVHAAVVLRAPDGDRAGRAGRELRARRPQPGLLHQRRRRGRRDRLEARQELLQAHRQADEAQGDQPRDRLPRHHRRARCRSPACRGSRQQFEPLVPVDLPGAQHQLLPRPEAAACSTAATSRRSAAGPPTRSPSRSRTRAPTPSPRSSSSRCRTPAAASRRRPATSSGSARSATSTTCCWSPTR